MVGVFCAFCASWRPIEPPTSRSCVPPPAPDQPRSNWIPTAGKTHDCFKGPHGRSFLRLLRLLAANPPLSVLIRPPSVFRRQPSHRFLRLLRLFAANPPLSVLSRSPSVFRRQPSHPSLAPFALLCGQPSAVRAQSSVFRRPPSHPFFAPFAPLGGQLNRATSCTCGPPPPPSRPCLVSSPQPACSP